MDTHFGSRSRTLVTDGVVSGLAGGIALAAPLVVWDWVQGAHRALELPMAATAWLFGLQHFSDQQNLWGSIVLGTVLLGLYAVVSGLTFAGLADHVFALRSPLAALLGGVAWSAASFMLFWYMLLPIARDGAPFRATAANPALFVAPNWVWILGFTVLGLVTGAVFAALHRPRAAAPESGAATEREFDRRLHYAA